jgi:hypothetical protein
MAISTESTATKILITIKDEGIFLLQRNFYKSDIWLTWTESGFVNLEELNSNIENPEEYIKPLYVTEGDFIDSFDLEDGLYNYRYVNVSIEEPIDKDYVYSEWVKFGSPDAIGYTFGNYKVPEGKWGTVVTPDDCRYTYLWGTDFKATNGSNFSDEQIQFFIDEATRYMERMLNISIIKSRIKCQAEDRGLIKGVDYDEEESLYDFSFRKIQRYGMIQTKHRPIINVEKLDLIHRSGDKTDLLPSSYIDRKKGVIKFLDRPYKQTDTTIGINTSLGRYGNETLRNHIFYSIDYNVGYQTSDEVPSDLRQIIAKVAAISLLNIIGDGLMSGFSSSSLSMDGISESFSSTQSATSAYFGARIQVYQKEVQEYIKDNKYRFGFLPIGTL